MHTGPCICVTCKYFHYTDRHDYPHTWGCICAVCGKDNLHNGWHYCTPINRELWRNNFANWKSGSSEVDKLIQESQLNANEIDGLMEWIEYSNLTDVEQIGEGAYGVVYVATWQDGPLKTPGWDQINKCPDRLGPTKVVVKKLKGGSSLSTEFLTEVGASVILFVIFLHPWNPFSILTNHFLILLVRTAYLLFYRHFVITAIR